MRHNLLRRGGALVAAAALVGGLGMGARAAEPAVDPGQGVALAQTAKIDPKAGGLSLGITFGQAIAAHQNSVAQATSQAINFGVIGSTMASEGCDGGDPTFPAEQQPQPLRVDSRDKDADKGKTATEYGMFTKSALANSTPYGDARTTTAPFSIPGVLSVGGGVAASHSGLVKGVREAVATVDISSIDLPGGIHLAGLHWEAVYRSSGKKHVAGKFGVGAASIGGQALPTADPSALFVQLNAALAPLGLRIVPPVAQERGGVLFVDPLAIAVVPSPQRDAVAGAALGAGQPLRRAVFDALLAMSCGNATYITIFDLVLGSVTGAGEFALALGGAQATSSEIPENQFRLSTGDYELAGGDVPLEATPSDDIRGTGNGLDSSGALPVADATAANANADAGPVAAPPLARRGGGGGRGGPLAAVGLAALALLGLLAEGDRRKMQRALREIEATDS